MKCDICNLTVAPNDPERKVHGSKVYHQSCVLRNIRRQQEIRQEQQLQVVQVVWDGKAPLSRMVQ